MDQTFKVILTDNRLIESGDFAGGAYSIHQEPHGVTLVFLAERKEVTYPWHQIARVEVIDKPQSN